MLPWWQAWNPVSLDTSPEVIMSANLRNTWTVLSLCCKSSKNVYMSNFLHIVDTMYILWDSFRSFEKKFYNQENQSKQIWLSLLTPEVMTTDWKRSNTGLMAMEASIQLKWRMGLLMVGVLSSKGSMISTNPTKLISRPQFKFIQTLDM